MSSWQPNLFGSLAALFSIPERAERIWLELSTKPMAEAHTFNIGVYQQAAKGHMICWSWGDFPGLQPWSFADALTQWVAKHFLEATQRIIILYGRILYEEAS